jgi:hypothetical protein
MKALSQTIAALGARRFSQSDAARRFHLMPARTVICGYRRSRHHRRFENEEERSQFIASRFTA